MLHLSQFVQLLKLPHGVTLTDNMPSATVNLNSSCLVHCIAHYIYR